MNLSNFSSIHQRLRRRAQTKIGSSYRTTREVNSGIGTIFCASSEHGVIRNGGRRGSVYGPQAILSELGKFALPRDWHGQSLYIQEVATAYEQLADNFDEAQKQEAHSIAQALVLDSPVIHLGGGHDHIYPWVRALITTGHRVLVINIDAHTDTRDDDWNHSGTPFRQLLKEYPQQFRLCQIGIHAYSNPDSNYKGLGPDQHQVHFLEDGPVDLTKALNVKAEELILLSLDCDALDAQLMAAVSAVNPNGLSALEMNYLFEQYQVLIAQRQQAPLFGIYEYNPVYDDLSGKGAKYLASLIYSLLN